MAAASEPQKASRLTKKKSKRRFSLVVLLFFTSIIALFGWFQLSTNPPSAEELKHLRPNIIKTYGHDPQAYTQGLLVHEGRFFESTGQYGKSTLREVEIRSGKVLRKIKLDDSHFGEGLAYLDGKLYQLTWRAGKAFVYRLEDFELLKTHTYEGEGWGLTDFKGELVMSDGSNRLTFRDPDTFNKKRQIQVFQRGRKVGRLNELEAIDGLIWANIYTSKDIVLIHPRTGAVLKRFSFPRLPRKEEINGNEDYLNGIAYDAQGERLFITGKNFSKVYELELVEQQR